MLEKLLGLHMEKSSGDFCVVLGFAIDHKTSEYHVTYKSLADGKTWTKYVALFSATFTPVSNEELKEMFNRPVSIPVKYFSYDPEGNGFDIHDSMREALNESNDAIQSYLKDRWDESVDRISCGVITHTAKQYNREDRPPEAELDENGLDENGTYWEPDMDYRCNYEMTGVE